MARIAANRKVCDELLTDKQVQLREIKADARIGGVAAKATIPTLVWGIIMTPE